MTIVVRIEDILKPGAKLEAKPLTAKQLDNLAEIQKEIERRSAAYKRPISFEDWNKRMTI